MRNRLITAIESTYTKGNPPKFDIGDTVEVGVRIVEGGKERVQPFIGVVIGRRGSGINATFSVRRIVNNEGVERTFPLHSPKVAHVDVVRHGKVRRSKLYYLRERVGKARKLAERRESSGGEEKPATEGRTRETALAGAV